MTPDGEDCVAIQDPCIESGNCPDGEWIPLTLPNWTLVEGEENIQTIVVDPVRPNDFYAFANSEVDVLGIWVSTDYGDSWTQRNQTQAFVGAPWGAAIDPNPARDANTPPTLWSPAGYGAGGAWKSTDGGVTWVQSEGANTAFFEGAGGNDLYQVLILPDDPPNHVVATYHYGFTNRSDGQAGIGETWDGGETWVIHQPPDGFGNSHYVIPISGTTWGVISQGGTGGLWLTTTAGRTGGTAGEKYRDGTISTSAWTKVGNYEHVHGSYQDRVLPDGRIFIAADTTGALSTDQGATWQTITGSPHMSNMMVTDSYIYTNYAFGADMARAPLDNPFGTWETNWVPPPNGYLAGGSPYGAAASYNASADRWILIASSWKGIPLMKYVEPPQ
jgi:hypothetical protein